MRCRARRTCGSHGGRGGECGDDAGCNEWLAFNVRCLLLVLLVHACTVLPDWMQRCRMRRRKWEMGDGVGEVERWGRCGDGGGGSCGQAEDQ